MSKLCGSETRFLNEGTAGMAEILVPRQYTTWRYRPLATGTTSCPS